MPRNRDLCRHNNAETTTKVNIRSKTGCYLSVGILYKKTETAMYKCEACACIYDFVNYLSLGITILILYLTCRLLDITALKICFLAINCCYAIDFTVFISSNRSDITPITVFEDALRLLRWKIVIEDELILSDIKVMLFAVEVYYNLFMSLDYFAVLVVINHWRDSGEDYRPRIWIRNQSRH